MIISKGKRGNPSVKLSTHLTNVQARFGHQVVKYKVFISTLGTAWLLTLD